MFEKYLNLSNFESCHLDLYSYFLLSSMLMAKKQSHMFLFGDSLFMYSWASLHQVIFSANQSSKNGDLQRHISTEIGRLLMWDGLGVSPLHSRLIHHLFLFRVFGWYFIYTDRKNKLNETGAIVPCGNRYNTVRIEIDLTCSTSSHCFPVFCPEILSFKKNMILQRQNTSSGEWIK